MVSQIKLRDTDSLRKHKPLVLCSLSLSTNYVIVTGFSRNISGTTNLVHSEKGNLQVPVKLSFQSLSSFHDKEKSAKSTYFVTERCFIHPPLIFVTQILLISLQHIKLWISLLSQSLWTLPITWWHERSTINSESCFAEVVS